MRLLADANLEGPIVRLLRAAGYDVVWVREEQPRATDPRVLELARAEARVLLTNDKDFAELCYLRRQATAGIVLLRLPAARSTEKGEHLLAVIRRFGIELEGWFTVITARAIRRRQLPDTER